jgi:hypothetical protein
MIFILSCGKNMQNFSFSLSLSTENDEGKSFALFFCGIMKECKTLREIVNIILVLEQ